MGFKLSSYGPFFAIPSRATLPGVLVLQEFWMTGDNNGRWAGNTGGRPGVEISTLVLRSSFLLFVHGHTQHNHPSREGRGYTGLTQIIPYSHILNPTQETEHSSSL